MFRPNLISGFCCLGLCAVVFLRVDYLAEAQQQAPKEDPVQVQDVQSKLNAIKQKIERENGRLSVLQAKRAGMEEELSYLNKEIDSIKSRGDKLRTEVSEMKERSVILEGAVKRVEETVVAQKSALEKRIVSIYKMNRRNVFIDYIFGSKDSVELIRRLRYAKVIAAYDRANLTRLGRLIDRLSEEKSELVIMKQSYEESLGTLSALEKELGQKKIAQGKLVRQAKEQEKLQGQTVDKLIDSAKSLESVLAGVMGGRVEPSTVPRKVTRKGTPKAVIKDFKGLGLAALRGKMSPPVQGTIIRNFGKRKHDKFSDILLNKGVDFQARVGSRVASVAKGKVVLKQILPEYGNVVIVDHGKRYYSLYGRIASTLVNVGDEVELGQGVAVVGEADKAGRNFYFEIRHKGKAIDPAKFFKKT